MAVSGGECEQLQHPCKGSVVPSFISPQVTGLCSFHGMCLLPFPIALTLSVRLVKYVGVQHVSQMTMSLLSLWLKIQRRFSLGKIQGSQRSYASNVFGTAGRL